VHNEQERRTYLPSRARRRLSPPQSRLAALAEAAVVEGQRREAGLGEALGGVEEPVLGAAEAVAHHQARNLPTCIGGAVEVAHEFHATGVEGHPGLLYDTPLWSIRSVAVDYLSFDRRFRASGCRFRVEVRGFEIPVNGTPPLPFVPRPPAGRSWARCSDGASSRR
jgi:hypothetical protein